MGVRVPPKGFKAIQDRDSLLVLADVPDISGIRFQECEADPPFLFLLADPHSLTSDPEFIGLRICHLRSLVSDLERVNQRDFYWQRMDLSTFVHDLMAHAHSTAIHGEVEAFYRIAREIGVYTNSFTLVPEEEQRRTA